MLRVYLFTIGVPYIMSLSAQEPSWDWGIGQIGIMYDVATDAHGDSYVVGRAHDSTGFMGYPTLFGGGFLAKVSPAGSVLWSQPFNSVIFEQIELKNNTLYAAGYGSGDVSIGSYDTTVDSALNAMFVVAFDTAGNELWISPVLYPNNLSVADIDANSSGELFLTGSAVSPLYIGTDTVIFEEHSQVLVMKHALGGIVEWVTTAGAPTKCSGRGIACDDLGAVYVTGSAPTELPDHPSAFFGSFEVPYPDRFFLTKVNGAGQFDWLVHSANALGNDVEYLGNDTLVVTGSFYDSSAVLGTPEYSVGGDMFIRSFDTNGNFGWDFRSDVTSNAAYLEGRRLESVSDGSLFISSIAVGPGMFEGEVVNTLGYGLQVSKFSRSGSRYWTGTMAATPLTNENFIEVYGLSSDSTEHAYVSGTLFAALGPDPQLTWDNGFIPGNGSAGSMFIARTDDDAVGMTVVPNKNGIGVFPNPGSDCIAIRIAEPAASWSATIHSCDGRQVLEGTSHGNTLMLDVRSLPAGLYHVQILVGKERSSLRFEVAR